MACHSSGPALVLNGYKLRFIKIKLDRKVPRRNHENNLITESAQAFVEDRTLQGISTAKRNFDDPSQFAKIEKYHDDKALWVLQAWTEVWLSPEFSDWSLKSELPKVQSPLLAIHGGKDEYGSLEFPKTIVRLAGGFAEELILPDCGHVPHKEMPETVVDSVTKFLKTT